MNEEVRNKLIRARAALIVGQPFFGTLALRLQLVADNSVPTLAVDGRHIFYNEDFCGSLEPPVLQAAVAHEVGHCMFGHITRRGSRSPRKWNQAGDYVINDMLKDSGFTLGESWLYNPVFKGMTADEVYNLLPDNEGEGEDPLCNIRQADAASGDDAVQAAEWKVATIQAATAAKAQGNLPANMARFVEELTTPKVDWRAQLRRFITETNKNDYCWQRPNRRFLAHGFMLPGLFSENMGLLVSAIDTSGSIAQEVLTAFGAEVSAAWDAVRPERLVNVYCDAAVNRVDEFVVGERLHFEMCGGGGTDFRPPFAYVEEKILRPACFIYLTDGYGPFPDAPPPYPVLWAMTTDVIPPWGEYIKIEL